VLTVLIFILTLALALTGAIGAGMALRRALARVSLSGVLGPGSWRRGAGYWLRASVIWR
jgi:hypothetical protein